MRCAAGLGLALVWSGQVCAELGPQDDPSPGPLRVRAGTDVVGQWQPHQHLYVKGDLGVGAAQLDELESWLDQQAGNWTVVLLETGQDEEFTDAEGSRYSGLDAVEHALGKGLPNRTAFGQLTDPRTGELNGAFFVLFLKDRKFSYFASDAMDRRGLGEDRWQGNLDRPAIAAMRGGARVVDAVKDTITHIEQRLTQRIEADKAEIQRREAAAQAEREKALDRAQAGIEKAGGSLDQLGLSLEALRSTHPEMAGDIARPDVARMRADLVSAQAALEGGNAAASIALSENVAAQADLATKAIADHGQAGRPLALLGLRINQLAGHPYAQSAEPAIDDARAAFGLAQQAYTQGDSAYAPHMDDLRAAVQATEARIEGAVRAARRQRTLVASVSGLALACLICLGLGLNLRRRPSRRKALALVDTWSRGIGDKTTALFELLDRTHGMLGRSAEEAAARHTGRTLELSEQVIRGVDEMMIMSACAGQVLSSAKALALPAGLYRRAASRFTVRPFRAAVRRLQDEPIVFRPEDGLELVVRGPTTERETLLGSVESYQPFTMTFEELMKAFNERAAKALAALRQVEDSVYTVGDLLAAVENRIRQAEALEQQIQAAGPDTWFRAAPVFSDLLPAARAAHADAVKQAVRDPVAVVEQSAKAAQRKAQDAEAIARLAVEFHTAVKPTLTAAAATLGAVPLEARWLAESIDLLSSRADEIALAAVEEPAAESIGTLARDVQGLADRAEQVVALDQARRDVALKSVEEAAERIRAARAELGEAIGLPPDKILREPQADPSDRVDQARAQAGAVKAALERGDVQSAQQGLDQVAGLTRQAAEIVQATREAFAAHAADLDARTQEAQGLADRVPGQGQVLARIQRDYAPPVLLLGEGDPTHPRANDTIQDNLDEVRAHLAEIRTLMDRSQARHAQGAFLEAAECLRQAAARKDQAQFRLQEIADKGQRLQATETSNAQTLAGLQTRAAALEAEARDPRTAGSTVQALDEARARLDRAVRSTESTPKDPFAAAAELGAAGQALALVYDQVRKDWAAHADAGRTISAACAQLDAVNGLARRAQADGVPDSDTIRASIRDADALAGRMDRVRGQLAVAHGNWAEVQQEADRVLDEAGRLAAALRGELEAGQAALAAIQAATDSVRSMGRWRGGFGVTILGAPGAQALDQAVALLQAGSYRQALSAAESARQAAQAAVAEAEAEQRKRRLAEEERLLLERRRRQEEERRRSQSWSSSGFGHTGHSPSGFGHSGVGGSTFSSHSGAGHSSFHSSSGTSRSGW